MTELEKMDDAKKADFLWRVIGRFDFYINSTNTKSAFLLAFNTFVIGAVVANWSSVLGQFSGYPLLYSFGAFLLFTIVIAALGSSYATFQVVSPFLSSNKKIGEYHSSIFFGDVAEYDSANAYCAKVLSETSADHLRDLAYQAHILSRGTAAKFDRIKKAVTAVVFVLLPAMFLFLLLKLGVVIYEMTFKAT